MTTTTIVAKEIPDLTGWSLKELEKRKKELLEAEEENSDEAFEKRFAEMRAIMVEIRKRGKKKNPFKRLFNLFSSR